MGGVIKYTTEMYSYVASFAVALNGGFRNKLPPDLQELVTKSVTGVEKEVGEAWDALDSIGKKLLVDGGAEPIRLSAAENARFRKIGAQVAEARIRELEGKGMPARAIYTMMKTLSEKHAKTSRSFWDQVVHSITLAGSTRCLLIGAQRSILLSESLTAFDP